MSGSFSMFLDHEAREWIAAAMTILAFGDVVQACKHWCIQVLPILQLHLQCILCLLLVDV